jgi:hypothetical protein
VLAAAFTVGWRLTGRLDTAQLWRLAAIAFAVVLGAWLIVDLLTGAGIRRRAQHPRRRLPVLALLAFVALIGACLFIH